MAPYCEEAPEATPIMSSDDVGDRIPEETLAHEPEPRVPTDPDPFSPGPELDGPTGVSVDDGEPLLADAAMGEETLLTWFTFGGGMDTVTIFGL